MGKISEFLNDLVLPTAFSCDMTQNKNRLFSALTLDMLSRTIKMFEYEGLPDTLSARSMEIQMQTKGYCVITKIENPLYGKSGLYCMMTTGVAGELNAERLPTKMTINDSWLNVDKEVTIDDDCIVIPNDVLWRGLGDLFSLYGGQLADAETTMRLQLYNSRINKILTATDDKVIAEAKDLLESIKNGKWGVIGDSVEMMGMMKALSSVDFTSPHAGTLKDTMEVMQYYRAQWFIALGLNDNFNMKREALNGSETESNENTLFALPLMMLHEREEGIRKLNEKYGLNVSVRFGSVWSTAYEKYLLSLEVREKEAEQTATDDQKPQEDKTEVKEDE